MVSRRGVNVVARWAVTTDWKETHERSKRSLTVSRTKEGSPISEFYVDLAAFVWVRSQITDYEAAHYHGPYETREEADRIADLIRGGETASTARHKMRTQQRGMALTVISGIAVAVGIIMISATSSTNAVCNSDIGHLGQAFSGSTLTHCAADAAVHSLGVIILIVGILGILGGIGTLFGTSIRRL
jgi:hypothetical protein